MEFVIYNDREGCGYIAYDRQEIQNEVSPRAITINNKTISPGDITTVYNYYCRPVKYLGLKKGEAHCEMLFELGTEADLFGEKIFLACLFKIEENRVFEMFGENFGRDFWYKNNKWK